MQVLVLTQQVSTFLLSRVSRAPDGVLTPSGSGGLDSPRSSGLPGTASPTADGVEGAAAAASLESLRSPQDRPSPTGVCSRVSLHSGGSHLDWIAALQTVALLEANLLWCSHTHCPHALGSPSKL